jgi:hypothetical protein
MVITGTPKEIAEVLRCLAYNGTITIVIPDEADAGYKCPGEAHRPDMYRFINPNVFSQ